MNWLIFYGAVFVYIAIVSGFVQWLSAKTQLDEGEKVIVSSVWPMLLFFVGAIYLGERAYIFLSTPRKRRGRDAIEIESEREVERLLR